MASSSSLALFFTLNLLFFTIATACGTCPGPKPTPTPKPHHKPSTKCPIDTLKLGVCADVLGLIHISLGKTQCCALLGNLADLDAAVCLCTALKANVLGISLNIPVNLSLLLNYCGKKVPYGFKCA